MKRAKDRIEHVYLAYCRPKLGSYYKVNIQQSWSENSEVWYLSLVKTLKKHVLHSETNMIYSEQKMFILKGFVPIFYKISFGIAFCTKNSTLENVLSSFLTIKITSDYKNIIRAHCDPLISTVWNWRINSSLKYSRISCHSSESP